MTFYKKHIDYVALTLIQSWEYLARTFHSEGLIKTEAEDINYR